MPRANETKLPSHLAHLTGRDVVLAVFVVVTIIIVSPVYSTSASLDTHHAKRGSPNFGWLNESDMVKHELSVPVSARTQSNQILWDLMQHPSLYGNDPDTYVENILFQAAVPTPVDAIHTNVTNWQKCVELCVSTSWCSHWVYHIDLSTFAKILGQCTLHTGTRNTRRAPIGVQTVGGTRQVKINNQTNGGLAMSSLTQHLTEESEVSHFVDWDVGFTYQVDGLSETDLIATSSSSSSSNCLNQCEEVGECVGWEFDASSLTCTLMNDFKGRQQASPFVTSALKSGKSSHDFFPSYSNPIAIVLISSDDCIKPHVGLAIVGEPLNSRAVPLITDSFDACLTECKAKSECVAFEWGSANGGCYRYRHVSMLVNEPSFVMGFTSCLNEGDVDKLMEKRDYYTSPTSVTSLPQPPLNSSTTLPPLNSITSLPPLNSITSLPPLSSITSALPPYISITALSPLNSSTTLPSLNSIPSLPSLNSIPSLTIPSFLTSCLSMDHEIMGSRIPLNLTRSQQKVHHRQRHPQLNLTQTQPLRTVSTLTNISPQVASVSDCLHLCRQTHGCLYWSFNQDLYTCSLFKGLTHTREARFMGVVASGAANCDPLGVASDKERRSARPSSVPWEKMREERAGMKVSQSIEEASDEKIESKTVDMNGVIDMKQETVVDDTEVEAEQEATVVFEVNKATEEVDEVESTSSEMRSEYEVKEESESEVNEVRGSELNEVREDNKSELNEGSEENGNEVNAIKVKNYNQTITVTDVDEIAELSELGFLHKRRGHSHISINFVPKAVTFEMQVIETEDRVNEFWDKQSEIEGDTDLNTTAKRSLQSIEACRENLEYDKDPSTATPSSTRPTVNKLTNWVDCIGNCQLVEDCEWSLFEYDETIPEYKRQGTCYLFQNKPSSGTPPDGIVWVTGMKDCLGPSPGVTLGPCSSSGVEVGGYWAGGEVIATFDLSETTDDNNTANIEACQHKCEVHREQCEYFNWDQLGRMCRIVSNDKGREERYMVGFTSGEPTCDQNAPSAPTEPPIDLPPDQPLPPVIPTLPSLPPKNPGGDPLDIWTHVPDPSDHGYNLDDFLFDIDLQPGMVGDGPHWGIWWGDWEGFEDWRHCLSVCNDEPLCNFWVFVFDPAYYEASLGGCYLKTGPLSRGQSGDSTLQLITGVREAESTLYSMTGYERRKLRPTSDHEGFVPEGYRLLEPEFLCLDWGFSYYIPGWMEPTIIDEIQGVPIAADCMGLCEAHPGCAAFQFENGPWPYWSDSRRCLLFSDYIGKIQNNPWSLGGTSGCRDWRLTFDPIPKPDIGEDVHIPVQSDDHSPQQSVDCLFEGFRVDGDLVGNEYGIPIHGQVPSAATCQLLCQRTPTCAAFDWSPFHGGCYLYWRVRGGLMQSSEMVAGGVTCEEGVRVFKVPMDVRYDLDMTAKAHRKKKAQSRMMNDDVGIVEVGRGEELSEWRDKSNEASQEDENNGVETNNPRSLQSQKEWTTSDLQDATTCEMKDVNIEYVGDDLDQEGGSDRFFIPTPTDCSHLCMSTYGCMHWTHNADQSICRLKKTSDRPEPTFTYGVTTSGPVNCLAKGSAVTFDVSVLQPMRPTECKGLIEYGVEYEGPDLPGSGQVVPFWSDCQALCVETLNCLFFMFKMSGLTYGTLGGGYCHLKSDDFVVVNPADTSHQKKYVAGPRDCVSTQVVKSQYGDAESRSPFPGVMPLVKPVSLRPTSTSPTLQHAAASPSYKSFNHTLDWARSRLGFLVTSWNSKSSNKSGRGVNKAPLPGSTTVTTTMGPDRFSLYMTQETAESIVQDKPNTLSAGAIVGIVLGSIASALLLLAASVCCCRRWAGSSSKEGEYDHRQELIGADNDPHTDPSRIPMDPDIRRVQNGGHHQYADPSSYFDE